MTRITSERNQRALLELASQHGNDICADCKANVPRWGSFSLGIFLCVHCASIHRKIGTHISKVKSLTLDSWTKEQVERMREVGNVKSNNMYNPNEARNPPPTNLVDAERDSELEIHIRSKYQFKRFLAKYGESNTLKLTETKTKTSSFNGKTGSVSTQASSPPLSSHTKLNDRLIAPSSSHMQAHTGSQSPEKRPMALLAQSIATVPTSNGATQPAGTGLWADLVSLQGPGRNSSLPLQMQMPPAPQQQPLQTGMGLYPAATGLGVATLPQHPAVPFGITAYTPTTAPFLTQQQSTPYMVAQAQAPMAVTVASPQPQYLHPQSQNPTAMTGVVGMNGTQTGIIPAHGSAFLPSSSPAIQQRFTPSLQQQPAMMSTTPQPQTSIPSLSTTPQLPMLVSSTMLNTASQQPMGLHMSPAVPMMMQSAVSSFPTGSGMGMSLGTAGTGTLQAQSYMSTTTQPQSSQLGHFPPMQQQYLQQQPQMHMQYGGFQGVMHPVQSFATGAYAGAAGGGQWSAM